MRLFRILRRFLRMKPNVISLITNWMLDDDDWRLKKPIEVGLWLLRTSNAPLKRRGSWDVDFGVLVLTSHLGSQKQQQSQLTSACHSNPPSSRRSFAISNSRSKSRVSGLLKLLHIMFHSVRCHLYNQRQSFIRIIPPASLSSILSARSTAR